MTQMPLQLPQDDLRQILAARHAIFLDIITVDGVVMLTESDPVRLPGHLDWLEREPMEEVVRGFSLLVKDGRVSAIFRLSRLNPATDAMLEDQWVSRLEALLPLSEDFRTFGD